jgi:hypothetical protein
MLPAQKEPLPTYIKSSAEIPSYSVEKDFLLLLNIKELEDSYAVSIETGFPSAKQQAAR